MKEKDEDLCEGLLHQENYALVLTSLGIETCLNNEYARCQLRTVGEPLISSFIALGLQKSNRYSKEHELHVKYLAPTEAQGEGMSCVRDIMLKSTLKKF